MGPRMTCGTAEQVTTQAGEGGARRAPAAPGTLRLPNRTAAPVPEARAQPVPQQKVSLEVAQTGQGPRAHSPALCFCPQAGQGPASPTTTTDPIKLCPLEVL